MVMIDVKEKRIDDAIRRLHKLMRNALLNNNEQQYQIFKEKRKMLVSIQSEKNIKMIHNGRLGPQGVPLPDPVEQPRTYNGPKTDQERENILIGIENELPE